MVLLIASLFFYAWGEPKYVFLMLISILVNYVMGIVIDQTPPSAKKKRLLILTLIVNIAILGYYKYAGFFIGIWEDLFHVDIEFEEVPLPIGISFYTFQAMSYIIDVYRQEVKAQRSLTDLSLFISLFPQLVAGPIVRYQTIAEQIKRRIIKNEDLMIGTRRFIQGLAKKC